MSNPKMKGKASIELCIGLMSLILAATSHAGSHAGPGVGAEDQTRQGRAALRNPRHQLWRRTAPEVYRLRFETTKGAFIVEAHRAWAPHGADRLYNLVRAGFFDDSRFFRVRRNNIAQFGISGDPVVAAVWKNETIPDDPVRERNVRGSIAFAMTGPNTRTTQIYINLVDNLRLDSQGFAPFATVVEGMEVVDQLYAGYDEDAGGGMRGGKQGPIFEGGNRYLDEKFPKLDKLIRATVLVAKK